MYSHNPNYFFKYVTPYKYDKNANCDEWIIFLNQVFNGNSELVDLSAEIFGYTLLGGEPFLHKAFCLIGNGRNGKSVYLSVLKALLSKQNYSAVSMEKLDQPFHAVLMDGKLANIVGESPSKETIPSDAFKALVSGDEIMVSYKGRDNYMMEPQARLFFASNSDPIFRDNSLGLQERLIIIPFDKTFLKEDIDTSLSERLIKTEIPGIINWSLNGLDRLLKRGYFPEVKASIDAKEMFKMDSDNVYAFYKKHFTHSDVVAEVIKITNFYDNYLRFCSESGERNPKSKKAFSRDFKNYVKQDLGDDSLIMVDGYYATKRLLKNDEYDKLTLSVIQQNSPFYKRI